MILYSVLIAALVVWTMLSLSPAESGEHGPTSRRASNAPIVAVAWGLTLALLAGLRYGVGTDYNAYRWLYVTYVDAGMSGLKVTQEPLLPILALVSDGIGWGYVGMFLLASLITVGTLLAVLTRRTMLTGFVYLIFVLSSTWQGSFNGVRQYLAAALIVLATALLCDGRRKAFVTLVALAATAHITAILCLAFAAVPQRKPRVMALVGVTGLMVVLATQTETLLGYFDYTRTEVRNQSTLFGGGYVTERVNALRAVFPALPVAFLMTLARTNRLTRFEWFAVNMTFVNAAVLAGSLSSAYAARFAIYTSIFACVAIPALIFRIPLIRDRVIMAMLVISSYAVFWWVDTSAQASLVNWQFVPWPGTWM